MHGFTALKAHCLNIAWIHRYLRPELKSSPASALHAACYIEMAMMSGDGGRAGQGRAGRGRTGQGRGTAPLRRKAVVILAESTPKAGKGADTPAPQETAPALPG